IRPYDKSEARAVVGNRRAHMPACCILTPIRVGTAWNRVLDAIHRCVYEIVKSIFRVSIYIGAVKKVAGLRVRECSNIWAKGVGGLSFYSCAKQQEQSQNQH